MNIFQTQQLESSAILGGVSIGEPMDFDRFFVILILFVLLSSPKYESTETGAGRGTAQLFGPIFFFLCSFFCFQSKRASTGSTGSALGFCNPLLHQRTTTFRVVTEMSSSSSSSSSSLPQNKSDSSRDFPSPSQWKRSYKIENIKKSSRK